MLGSLSNGWAGAAGWEVLQPSNQRRWVERHQRMNLSPDKKRSCRGKAIFYVANLLHSECVSPSYIWAVIVRRGFQIDTKP